MIFEPVNIAFFWVGRGGLIVITKKRFTTRTFNDEENYITKCILDNKMLSKIR